MNFNPQMIGAALQQSGMISPMGQQTTKADDNMSDEQKRMALARALSNQTQNSSASGLAGAANAGLNGYLNGLQLANAFKSNNYQNASGANGASNAVANGAVANVLY